MENLNGRNKWKALKPRLRIQINQFLKYRTHVALLNEKTNCEWKTSVKNNREKSLKMLLHLLLSIIRETQGNATSCLRPSSNPNTISYSYNVKNYNNKLKINWVLLVQYLEYPVTLVISPSYLNKTRQYATLSIYSFAIGHSGRGRPLSLLWYLSIYIFTFESSLEYHCCHQWYIGSHRYKGFPVSLQLNRLLEMPVHMSLYMAFASMGNLWIHLAGQ